MIISTKSSIINVSQRGRTFKKDVSPEGGGRVNAKVSANKQERGEVKVKQTHALNDLFQSIPIYYFLIALRIGILYNAILYQSFPHVENNIVK